MAAHMLRSAQWNPSKFFRAAGSRPNDRLISFVHLDVRAGGWLPFP
jgi:hypothetical protein